MLKKLLTLCLTGVLLVSTVGCKSNNTPSTGDKTGTAATSAPAKVVEISVQLYDRNNIPADQGTLLENRWTKWIQEEMLKQGVKVTYFPVLRNEEASKLNVLMASGSAPDMIYSYDRNAFLKYAAEGGLHDITDAVKKYGSNIEKHLGPANAMVYGQVDGKQYSIPGLRARPGWITSWIRKDWLDKLNLPLPTNRQELETALRAFKEKDPGGVGKDKVIPWGGYINSDLEFNAQAAMSFMNNVPEDYMTSPLQLRDGFKEYAQWMNKLYQDGILDPQFATRQIKDQTVGFYQEGWWVPEGIAANSQINVIKQAVPTAELVPVDVFKDKNGKYFKFSYVPAGFYNMVPKTSKNPEAVVKYINFLSQSDVGMKLQYGIEGEHYDLKDGVPVTKDTAYKAKTMAATGDLNAMYSNYPFSKDLMPKVLKSEYGPLGDLAVKAYDISTKDAVPEPYFGKQLESQKKYSAELKKAYLEGGIKIIMEKDFETAYNNFMKDIKAKGAEEVKKEMGELFKAAKK